MSLKVVRWVGWSVWILINAAACQSEETPPAMPLGAAGMSAPPPITGSTAPAPESAAAADPTFTQLYKLWTSNLMPAVSAMDVNPQSGGCSCHIMGTSTGLPLPDQATSYKNLVMAPSLSCPDNMLVVPGDPDNSVLYHALMRTRINDCMVAPMPAGFPAWQAKDLDLLRRWIMLGALNN